MHPFLQNNKKILYLQSFFIDSAGTVLHCTLKIVARSTALEVLFDL